MSEEDREMELRVQCYFDGYSEMEKKLGEVLLAINCVETVYNTNCTLFEIVYDDRD